MQLAKTLPAGESSVALSASLPLEHDEGVFSKRLFASFDSDYNDVSPPPYFEGSLSAKWGLYDYVDWGVSLSLGESSLGVKYNYFNIRDLSLATSAKILVNPLNFNLFESYALKFSVINSYEILDNLNIYINPAFIYYPVEKHQWGYLENSFGIVLGKDYGVVLEWSYRSPVEGDFDYSLEQLSVGVLTNINPTYNKKNSEKEKTFIVVAEFSSGLSQNFLGGLCFVLPLRAKQSFELGFGLGVGRTTEEFRQDNRLGWRSYFISRLAYRNYFADSKISYMFGFKYKKEQLNYHFTQGWHRFISKSVGVEVGLGYSFKYLQIDPIVFYFPASFIYSFSTVENTSGLAVAGSEKNNNYAKKASERIDVIFLRTKLFL
jgi:hypothetical protein